MGSRRHITPGASIQGFFYHRPRENWPTVAEACSKVVAAGLGVEVWSQRGRGEPELAGDVLARTRAVCSGSAFTTMHSSYAHWRWDPTALRAQIDLAAAIGAHALILHVGGLGLTKRGSQLRVPLVKRLAEHAASRNVRLWVENSSDGAWALDRILDEMGDDPETTNLGICIDIGHAHISRDIPGDPVLGYLERYRDVLRHLHLHDNDGRADDHRIPGQGTIDWDAVSSWLRSAAISVPAVLELHAEVDPMDAIDEAMATLARHALFSPQRHTVGKP